MTCQCLVIWGYIKRDMVKCCKECYTCQLGGKPNQNIPKAPLHPLPGFGEPFSHIIIDCVGPLPKTKSQNEYLLTINVVQPVFQKLFLLGALKQIQYLRP